MLVIACDDTIGMMRYHMEVFQIEFEFTKIEKKKTTRKLDVLLYFKV